MIRYLTSQRSKSRQNHNFCIYQILHYLDNHSLTLLAICSLSRDRRIHDRLYHPKIDIEPSGELVITPVSVHLTSVFHC